MDSSTALEIGDHAYRWVAIFLFSSFFYFSVVSYLRWQLPDKQRRMLEIMKKCRWMHSKREPAWIPYSLLVEVGGMLDATAAERENALEEARKAARRDYVLPLIFATTTALLGSIILLYGPYMIDTRFKDVSVVVDAPFYVKKQNGIADTSREPGDSDAENSLFGDIGTLSNVKQKVYLADMKIAPKFELLCQDDKECIGKVGTLQNLQVIVFAFIGAFIWSLTYIMRRLYVIDLDSNAFYSVGIRIILSNFIAIIFFLAFEEQLVSGFSGWIPAIAFMIGWFPRRVFQFMKEKVFSIIGIRSKEARSLPLEMLQGTQLFQRTRLSEAGIDDAENMANANLLELLIRTPFNPRLLIDWIGQAKLYLIFRDKIFTMREAKIRTIFDFIEVMSKDDSKDTLMKLLAKLPKDTNARKKKIQPVHEEELLTAWNTCKHDEDLEWLRSARNCLLGLEGKEQPRQA